MDINNMMKMINEFMPNNDSEEKKSKEGVLKQLIKSVLQAFAEELEKKDKKIRSLETRIENMKQAYKENAGNN